MSKAPVEVKVRTTNDSFGRFAAAASAWLGSAWAFAGAGFVIVIWAVIGPIFHYSNHGGQLSLIKRDEDHFCLLVFLVVFFLIQNTQMTAGRRGLLYIPQAQTN